METYLEASQPNWPVHERGHREVLKLHETVPALGVCVPGCTFLVGCSRCLFLPELDSDFCTSAREHVDTSPTQELGF